MSTLDELGAKHGTDKFSGHHDYLRSYEEFLNPERIGCLLELGVFRGSSLSMWREWLPNAVIVGVDNWSFPARMPAVVPGANVESADCTDATRMLEICEKYAPFDVIVDDASHRKIDQRLSLGILWPHLNPGGYYIIEDIPCGENRFPGASYVDGKRGEKFAYFRKEPNAGSIGEDMERDALMTEPIKPI